MSDIEQLFYKSIPGMIFGAMVGGLAFAARATLHVSDKFIERLKFQPEAFDMDLNVAELFLKLQQYRLLSPQDFDEAGWETDSLFCLEKQIMLAHLKWELYHPVTALGYSREMSKRLYHFLDIATEKLYSDRVQQRELFEQQRQAQASANEDRAQLLKDIEQGKQIVREISQLIDDIISLVMKHVTKMQGGFRTPSRSLFRNMPLPTTKASSLANEPTASTKPPTNPSTNVRVP